MPDARGVAGRKVVGTTYGGAVAFAVPAAAANAASACGRSPESISMTAGVRTRLLSVQGKGAIRMAAFQNNTGSTVSFTHELWLDGVLIRSATPPTFPANGSGCILVGTGQTGATNPAVVADFLPFDGSCEVYLTSAGSGAVGYFNMVDLHQ